MRLAFFIFFCLILAYSLDTTAQEENYSVAREGSKYIDIRIKSLDKYNSRVQRQQQHLLNRLDKKEKRFTRKLSKSDSVLYAKYKTQALSYDSIKKLSNSDSSLSKLPGKKNRQIDTLKKIQSFIEKDAAVPASSPQIQEQNEHLNDLQKKMNAHDQISKLISQHTDNIKKLVKDQADVPGLSGIQKQVFYYQSHIKVWKHVEEEPTAAENKALEYLQGQKGFDQHMSNFSAPGNASTGAKSGTDESQLDIIGAQTKGKIQSSLQQKFGGGIGNISKQMGGDLSKWNDKQNQLSDAKEAKKSAEGLKKIDKPAFKVNSMRGLPFWKRIEKQYNFQVTRPTQVSAQPAAVTPSGTIAFRHTPKLSYGIGAAISAGLGKSWQSIHPSFEGIGYRTFAEWKWQYGISCYAGYERMYHISAFTQNKSIDTADVMYANHANKNYQESILVGLTKTYHINNKYSGAIQLLYDIWWQQKGLNSPFVIRFATIKK